MIVLSLLLSQGHAWSVDDQPSLRKSIVSNIVFANGSPTHNFNVSALDNNGDVVGYCSTIDYHNEFMPLSGIKKVAKFTAIPQLKTATWLANLCGINAQSCVVENLETLYPHLHKLMVITNGAQSSDLTMLKKDLTEQEKRSFMMQIVKNICQKKGIPLSDVYHRVQLDGDLLRFINLEDSNMTEEDIIGDQQSNVIGYNNSLVPKKLTMQLVDGDQDVTLLPGEKAILCKRSQYQGSVIIGSEAYLGDNVVSNLVKNYVYAQPEGYDLPDSDIPAGKNWAICIGVSDVVGVQEKPSEQDKLVGLYNAITNGGKKESVLNKVYQEMVNDN